MFKTFNDDLIYLPRRKFNAKYTVPLIIGLFSYVVIGQVIQFFIPLSALNKTSGRIAGIQTVISSYSHSRYSSHDTPNYALAITLDDAQTYNVQETDARVTLGKILKTGDSVTIYYPTLAVKIISVNLARDVSQVEESGKVLYSWQQQKQSGLYIIPLFLIFIGVFYWLRGYLNNYMDASMLK